MRKLFYIAVLVLIASTAFGDTITVGPSGRDYTTIGGAVSAASSGDLILVYDDTYDEESINITTPNITIQAVNEHLAIMDGSDTTDHAFEINADNVKIIGFKIQNYKPELRVKA